MYRSNVTAALEKRALVRLRRPSLRTGNSSLSIQKAHPTERERESESNATIQQPTQKEGKRPIQPTDQKSRNTRRGIGPRRKDRKESQFDSERTLPGCPRNQRTKEDGCFDS